MNDNTSDQPHQLALIEGSPPKEQRQVKLPRVLRGDMGPILDPESIVYQHTVMCQTVLPYRDPEELHTWTRRQGDVLLSLSAGEAYNGFEMVTVPLPFGPKARLALYHLNTQAVLSKSRHVEVGDSLTAFVKRLGLAGSGRNISSVKDQLTRLAACRLAVGYTQYSYIISTGDLCPKPAERKSHGLPP